MVSITFPDRQMGAKALGFLAGRFSFKSFDNGTTLVPEVALGYLAAEDVHFTCHGRVTYSQLIPTIRHADEPQGE